MISVLSVVKSDYQILFGGRVQPARRLKASAAEAKRVFDRLQLRLVNRGLGPCRRRFSCPFADGVHQLDRPVERGL